jgi:hypothetical protein
MALTPPIVTNLNVMQQGALNFPSEALWVDNVHLAANAAKAYSIATLLANSGITEKNVFLVFSADGPFWANFQGGTAAIPSGDVLTGASAEFSPNQRYIDLNCRSISFIAAAATNVSIQVYQPG